MLQRLQRLQQLRQSGSWDEYNNQYRIFRLLYNGGSVSFNGYSPDITGFKYGYLKPVRRIQVCITPPITTTTTTTTTLPTTTTTTTTLPSLFSLTTNSTSSAWTAYITKSGVDLHWEITGANTFSYDGNSPTFDFSASSGNNYITVTSIDGSSGLTNLELYSLNITELNVSGAVDLTYLDCNSNQLTSLNVSTNTTLTYLDCNSNQLTSLNVSTNTALTYIDLSYNQLTSLNVSNNSGLTDLYCYNNQLITLDVSNNIILVNLDCNNNQLTILDVSNNSGLSWLNCSYNQLTLLNISNNSGLTGVNCSSNLLTSLSVSNNNQLTYLVCYNNQITKTDVDIMLSDLIIYNLPMGYFDSSNQTPPAYADTGLVSGLTAIWNVVIVDIAPITTSTTTTTTTTINCGDYGLLYNWYAVDNASQIFTDKAHIPTDTEWANFDSYLSYTPVSIVETGNTHWVSPLFTATNSLGFNLLPSGDRNVWSDFGGLGYHAYHWSSSITFDPLLAWMQTVLDNGYTSPGTYDIHSGLAVRLIIDTPVEVSGSTAKYYGNDGRQYDCVLIDGIWWLAKNLFETQYRDSSTIPIVSDSLTWSGLATGAMCAYNNDWSLVECGFTITTTTTTTTAYQ